MARISLLGPPHLERDGKPVVLDTRKTVALVAYLAMAGQSPGGDTHTREALATLLWPEVEPQRARANLRRSLSVLRKGIGGEWLITDRETIGIHPHANFWLDVAQFRGLLSSPQTHGHPQVEICSACLEALAEAVELYRGDFLEGFSLRDSADFDDWQFFQTEGLRQELAVALERLVRGHSAQGTYEQAIAYGRRWVALDSLHEPAQRQLMQLYALAGQRAAALRQYAECARILREELDLPPSEATTFLYEQIRTARTDHEVTLRQAPLLRHNLPAQPTPFVGRQAQLAVVRETLGRPEVRLLTLTGPGGTGKTRLALQAAGYLLDEFEDGVFFVALAPIRDPSFLLPAIAQTLGIRETTDRALLEQLAEELHDKRALLVLDNFEQIADAAPLVSDLLGAAAPLKVLVTSRTLLHVYGEHSYPVPPMALPDPQDLPDLERLRQTEAVRLFIQRAQAVKPGFVLSDKNAAAVIGICTRLDGLPLAIELAAARVRLLPPQAILSRLADRFRFLTGGPRDLPARHQTLRAAIAWSYDLLQAGEKALLHRLAVFVGGCSLEAAEALCCGSGELDVLDGLQGLVDKNLALCRDVQGEPRFLMLETVREYALEQLAASGRNEAEEMRGQHASFFLALAEGAELELWGADQAAWMDRLDIEHDNLRSALEWSLQRGAVDPDAAETGLRLAGPLWKFWHDRAHLKEGRRWLELALACPLGQGRARARVLVAAGTMAWQLGDYAKARSYFEQGAAGCREEGDRAGLAEALHLDGHLALDEGEHGQARALFQESLRLYQEMGEASISLVLTQDLALLAYHQGAFEEARVQFEAGLATSRELGQEDLTGTTLNRLGELARLRGDDDEATALFEEGLTISRELQLKPEIPSFLKNLGHVARCRGDYEQARSLFAESLALQQEHGNKQGMAESLAGLASVAAQPECAVRLFSAVETLLDAVGAPLSPADRADLEHNLAAARAQLDEAAIAAAWAEGQALAADASATAWQRTIACALEA